MPLIKSMSPKAVGKNIETEMHAGKPKKQSIAIALSVKRSAQKRRMAQGGDITADSSTPESLHMLADKHLARSQELRAAAMRPTADESEARGEEMLDSHPTMDGQELDARDEHMSGIDGEKDARSQKMMMAQGGEVDLRDEKMTTIDDARDARSQKMLDSHPTRHGAEKLAGTKRVDEDSEDAMEMDMMKPMYAKGGIVDAIMGKRKSSTQIDQQANADEDLNNEDQLSFEAPRKDTYYDVSQLEDQPEDSNEDGHKIADEDSHDMVSKIRAKVKSKRS